jgi:hypothetical protein
VNVPLNQLPRPEGISHRDVIKCTKDASIYKITTFFAHFLTPNTRSLHNYLRGSHDKGMEEGQCIPHVGILEAPVPLCHVAASRPGPLLCCEGYGDAAQPRHQLWNGFCGYETWPTFVHLRSAQALLPTHKQCHLTFCRSASFTDTVTTENTFQSASA